MQAKDLSLGKAELEELSNDPGAVSVRGAEEDVFRGLVDSLPEGEPNQRAIVEYERLLDRLATLAEGFGSARDLQTVYRAIRDFAVASVPCVGLVISLYDPEREVRNCVYLWYNDQERDPSEIAP